MPDWSEKVVGQKHTHRITNKDIADKLNVTPEYISMALNGKKVMPDAEKQNNGRNQRNHQRTYITQ